MRDPVAEILAERAATGSGLGSAIAVSLILHAAGAGMAITAALRQPPPRPVSTVNIRFAQMPGMVPLTPAAAPPQPVVPRIQEPAPQPARPPAKKAADPPAKNSVPLSPFGRSTKKGSERPAPAPPPTPPASREATSTAGAGEIGIGETGVTALEGGDFPYTVYLDRMKRLIGGRWARPQVGGDARAIVYFRIDRDGTIRDAALTTGSGNGTFDRAALRAVIEASPLPPLPFGYSGHYLGVHLTFR
ncbi:MAG TPA: TonB family protein [Thermoanaerobaculia bacterium]|nr:TonB family protein [Thermoanaerobaculia bacterium]